MRPPRLLQHRTTRRIAIAVTSLVVLWVGYRVLAVYTVRTRPCLPVRTVDLGPDLPPRQAPIEPGRPDLVVMSYNVEGHAALLDDDHIGEVAAVIRQVNPDVVGLQEVHRHTWQARFEDQVSDLARLTGMRIVFGPSFEAFRGEFGNAILTRHPPRQCSVLPLPSVGEPRSALRCLLRTPAGDVAVLSTHLAAWGRLEARPRRRQIECLVEAMTASPAPAILVGDLNAPPEADEIGLLGAADLPVANLEAGATHRMTNRLLDYVVPDRRWTVTAARVVEEGPSDHRAVVAQLRLDPTTEEPTP